LSKEQPPLTCTSIWGSGILTASITNEAVDELKLETSKRATAVVKATDVMLGVQD
jgi:molybdopterin-binding protein